MRKIDLGSKMPFGKMVLFVIFHLFQLFLLANSIFYFSKHDIRIGFIFLAFITFFELIYIKVND